MALMRSLTLAGRQLWRAQFVRSSWDPASARPYRIPPWWAKPLAGKAHHCDSEQKAFSSNRRLAIMDTRTTSQ